MTNSYYRKSFVICEIKEVPSFRNVKYHRFLYDFELLNITKNNINCASTLFLSRHENNKTLK